MAWTFAFYLAKMFVILLIASKKPFRAACHGMAGHSCEKFMAYLMQKIGTSFEQNMKQRYLINMLYNVRSCIYVVFDDALEHDKHACFTALLTNA